MCIKMRHFQFSSKVGKVKVGQNDPHIEDKLYNLITILIFQLLQYTLLLSLSPFSLYSLFRGGAGKVGNLEKTGMLFKMDNITALF